MKRVGQLRRKYYYSPIENSPFTVVVAIPADYGNYRVDGEVELHRAHQVGEFLHRIILSLHKYQPRN